MSDVGASIKEFQVGLNELAYTGHDLVRPESVLTYPDGTLWVSDGRGGVTRIDPDGPQRFLGGLGGEPNGLARDGSLLVANQGTGSIQKLRRDGQIEEVLTEVDGVALTGANFVFRDRQDRRWISSTTRADHWWSADGAISR